VELWSRNHKPLSADYPGIVQALEILKCRNATLDGEIVALDEAGRSRFQLLQPKCLELNQWRRISAAATQLLWTHRHSSQLV